MDNKQDEGGHEEDKKKDGNEKTGTRFEPEVN